MSTESGLKAATVSSPEQFYFVYFYFFTLFVLTDLFVLVLTDSKFPLILPKEVLESLSLEIFRT